MGLDMYLKGDKFQSTDWENPENDRQEDGYKISSIVIELGYWRKHPNLHGYIVESFAEGVDECQDIHLTQENLEQILQSVADDELEPTSGFFFGKSQGADDQDTTKQIQGAIDWLKIKDSKYWKTVIYRASW